MGLNAAVQALKKAEELKARVSRHNNDLLNNSEVWSDQQQLQTVYHQVLVLDLEYALDKKVEQELWTLGFKNHIAALQHLSKDKKNPKRSEYQSLLSWCLEAASGFYLTLLQELCSAFELDLPFRRRGAVYGQAKSANVEQFSQPHKSSCLYICQYCLVHLGDIARYRLQRKQAESFYKHAILLSPSSGQPYNQLALLEASRGDKLATVFHYVRSICVKHPFPAAATNLANTFSALVDHDVALPEVHTKLNLNEFVAMFLRVHGLLHLANDLDHAELCVQRVNSTFTALVATHAFSSTKLIQMTVITLYALRNMTDSLTVNQMTPDEFRARNLILDLLAGSFSAYLLPIYTLKDDFTLLEYHALPAIKLILDWIKNDSNVLKECVFTKRLQIWPSLCKLLNSLQSICGDSDSLKSNKVPLPEDRDLQCFLPLMNAFRDLNFTTPETNDATFYNKLRVSRLIELGAWLCTYSVDKTTLITAQKPTGSKIVFEPSNEQPDPTIELLEELKHFNINEKVQETPKETKILTVRNSVVEKRGGILKPQGSLEKAREEREHQQGLRLVSNENSSTNNLPNSSRNPETWTKSKRTRQNVAMQALAKKVEESNKQVTFVTDAIVNKTVETEPSVGVTQMSNSGSFIDSPVMPLPVENINNFFENNTPIQNRTFPYNAAPTNYTLPFNMSNNKNTTPMPPFHQNVPNPIQMPTQPPFLRPPPPVNFDFNKERPGGYHFGNAPSISKENLFPAAHSWMPEEKLPMPPSTWMWQNSAKPNQHPYSQQEQPDLFQHSFSQYVPSMPSNDVNRHFSSNNTSNTAPIAMPPHYNSSTSSANNNMNSSSTNLGGKNTGNMSMWNSGPNIPLFYNQLQQQPIINLREPVVSEQQPQIQQIPDNSRAPGYSLFSSNWSPNFSVHNALNLKNTNKPSAPDRPVPLMRQQSFFSGPGLSPLERLLEQQKQLRGIKGDDT